MDGAGFCLGAHRSGHARCLSLACAQRGATADDPVRLRECGRSQAELPCVHGALTGVCRSCQPSAAHCDLSERTSHPTGGKHRQLMILDADVWCSMGDLPGNGKPPVRGRHSMALCGRGGRASQYCATQRMKANRQTAPEGIPCAGRPPSSRSKKVPV